SEVSSLGVTSGSLDGLPDAGIGVYDQVAADNGWTVGDTLEVEFPATGTVDLEVVAIYEESGFAGDYVIDLGTFSENVRQNLDVFVLVKTAEGADSTAVKGE